MRLSPCDSR
jgi:Male sterility protein